MPIYTVSYTNGVHVTFCQNSWHAHLHVVVVCFSSSHIINTSIHSCCAVRYISSQAWSVSFLSSERSFPSPALSWLGYVWTRLTTTTRLLTGRSSRKDTAQDEFGALGERTGIRGKAAKNRLALYNLPFTSSDVRSVGFGKNPFIIPVLISYSVAQSYVLVFCVVRGRICRETNLRVHHPSERTIWISRRNSI